MTATTSTLAALAGALLIASLGTAAVAQTCEREPSNARLLVVVDGIRDARGTITAQDGSEVQLTADAALSGGVLSTVGTGDIRNISSASLANLTNTGAFVGANNCPATFFDKYRPSGDRRS